MVVGVGSGGINRKAVTCYGPTVVILLIGVFCNACC
jgi:hypothetical protein